jgi:hypothetical protein
VAFSTTQTEKGCFGSPLFLLIAAIVPATAIEPIAVRHERSKSAIPNLRSAILSVITISVR